MEFVMILSAEIISFYLMCILASGIIYLFIPKSKTVIILVGNMIAGQYRFCSSMQSLRLSVLEQQR